MAMLSKAALLGATTLPRESVPTPEIEPGSSVLVQGLSAADRDELIQATTVGKGKKMRTDIGSLRLLLVAQCVVNDQGERVLTDEDAERLAAVRSDVIERIFTVAARLSGLNDDVPEDDAGEKKSVRVSGLGRSASSTTDSLVN